MTGLRVVLSLSLAFPAAAAAQNVAPVAVALPTVNVTPARATVGTNIANAAVPLAQPSVVALQPALVTAAPPTASALALTPALSRFAGEGERRHAGLATARTLSNVAAADPRERPQLAASVFDGSGKPKANDASAVERGESHAALWGLAPAGIVAPAWTGGAALPVAYIAHRYARERRQPSAESPRLRFGEVMEAAGGYVAVGFLSLIAAGVISNPWILGPALGLLWAGGFIAMRDMVQQSRRVVVGGWQASHDQRYRVGAGGKLVDVRGHKYGEDRWEEYAPGPTTPREKLALRVIAMGTGLAMAAAAGPLAAAAYGVTWTLATALADARRRPAAPRSLDSEEAGFVSRFNRE